LNLKAFISCQANYPEPDAATAMAMGSDPTTAASDITYSMGPQVGELFPGVTLVC